MNNGKLIVIEGTDCSGKETQTKKLVERLKENGNKAIRFSFPMYETATGKIIGACLLGKPQMTKDNLKENHSFFEEGGGEVDPLTACCLYAADRRYNFSLIEKYLNENYIVILDRYTPSNMAHRGGMIEDKEERKKMYKKIETLEYDVLELRRPDEIYLLYLPFEYGIEIKKNRDELLDEAERDEKYLRRGETTYLELAELYNYKIINCVKENKIRTIEDISDELYKEVVNNL